MTKAIDQRFNEGDWIRNDKKGVLEDKKYFQLTKEGAKMWSKIVFKDSFDFEKVDPSEVKEYYGKQIVKYASLEINDDSIVNFYKDLLKRNFGNNSD